MKVYMILTDRYGCGYYRIEMPGRVAELEGHEVVVEQGMPTYAEEMEDGSARVWVAPEMARFDVVVIQRPANSRWPQFARELQEMGVAVVLELDDDAGCLHPNHPGRSAYEGRADPDHHWKFVAEIARFADLVTVTTPALAERYAAHGRYAILPNCVPAMVLDLPPKSDGTTIGWTGAIHQHPGDQEVTHGGVQLALDDCPEWHFLKVGGGAELVQKGLGLKRRPQQTGPLDLDVYHSYVPMLDVGIVPLADTRFNEAKSDLKAVEYAACGIPFVASPVRSYQELHDGHGIGILAPDRARNWKSACKSLMLDESLRAEQVAAGREWAATRTFQANGPRWAEAWRQAIVNRQGA